MTNQACEAVFSVVPKLYVYMHARPNGSVFYIGKGSGRRAFDMAPSRRSKHHMNIVRKHGRANIKIRLIPAMSHTEAFRLERLHIALAKRGGVQLVNLTEGGEGSRKHQMTPKQIAALAKGRGRFRKLSAEAQATILVGLARGAAKLSPARDAHRQALGQAGAIRLHQLRQVVCRECGIRFATQSARLNLSCSRLCQQRNRRARQRD